MVDISIGVTSSGVLVTNSAGVLVMSGKKFVISATLNTGSASITIYEDTTGDGTADNQDTFSISGGTNEYDAGAFSLSSGNDLWYRLETDNATVTDTVEVDYIEAQY